MEPAAGIVTSESLTGAAMQRDESVIVATGTTTTTTIDNDDPVAQMEYSAKPSESLSIYCIYSANPFQLLPNSTRWFKDGQPLVQVVHVADSRPTDRFLESTTATGYPVLSIKHANRRDAGRYDCQVANSVGPSERLPASESCRLEVNFRPSVQLRLYRATKADGHEQGRRAAGANYVYPMDELAEVNVEQELVLAGASLVLVCDILEAKPGKIKKFHWFSGPASVSASARASTASRQTGSRSASGGLRLVGVSELGQFRLDSIQANFTPTSFACSASNAIGPSEQSNQIDLQLSYAPGK